MDTPVEKLVTPYAIHSKKSGICRDPYTRAEKFDVNSRSPPDFFSRYSQNHQGWDILSQVKCDSLTAMATEL